MDHELLTNCACWFGGGTEIVLDLDEYRLSKDIDFLCSDADGYRMLRTEVVSKGASALFAAPVRQQRPIRTDQYGIRGIIEVNDIPLRFEIIRESRIILEGRPDPALGVPRLTPIDRIAEKLLANADRGQDRATAFRDAIDLGMIALRHGPFPAAAWLKAEHAYGGDVRTKLTWVLGRLETPSEQQTTAATLGMDPALLQAAVAALSLQVS
jgi:hypothetical protein